MYMLPVKFDFRFKNVSPRLLLNFLCLLGLGVERKMRIHLHRIIINLKIKFDLQHVHLIILVSPN